MRYAFIVFTTFLLSVSILHAQNECPVLEQAAMAETTVFCSELSNGNYCFGGADVQVDYRNENVSPIFAGEQGNLVDVAILATVSNDTYTTFSMAVARVQAYSSEIWNIGLSTLVLIGDTQVTDLGTEGVSTQVVTAPIQSVSGANLRALPTIEGRLLTPLADNTVVKISGISSDNLWVRASLATGETGWLIRDIFTETFEDLPIVTPQDDIPELWQPYTNFDFTSSFSRNCDEATPHGILIQSPSKETTVNFHINDLDIELTGTAFLQANTESTLIAVIEGEANAGTDEQIVPIIGGQFASFTLVDGIPTLQQTTISYDVSQLVSLPIQLLHRYVYIATDLTTVIQPRPNNPNQSPLEGMPLDAPCRVTTGPTGSNLRNGPSTNYPIVGVLAFRESADPIGRTVGNDGNNWWQIAPFVWLNATTTVTGGDCFNVQTVPTPPLPPNLE